MEEYTKQVAFNFLFFYYFIQISVLHGTDYLHYLQRQPQRAQAVQCTQTEKQWGEKYMRLVVNQMLKSTQIHISLK